MSEAQGSGDGSGAPLKSGIAALCLFVLDAFVLNQGLIALLAIPVVAFWLVPKAVIAWRKKSLIPFTLVT